MATFKILHLKVKDQKALHAIADLTFHPSNCRETIPTILKNGGDIFYKHVATIEAKGLDDAFCKTQNIEESWVELLPETRGLIGGQRSSSVGDIFITEDGKHHVIDRFGFFEIEPAAENRGDE